jgi:2-polyprenyl-3-methyl-5-hydroxy-6-metoxy-1,4-benzoquinol methylase
MASAPFPETPDIETSSANYASRFKGPAGAYMLDVQEKSVLALLKDGRPLPGRAVLDVGGGHAQLAGPIAGLGCDVTVIGSDASCETRLRSGANPDKINFVIGNLLDMPFADRAFDTLVSVRLISHIEDWPKLVAELCRVAGKSIVIDYPTWRSVNALSLLTFPLKKAIEKNTRTYTTFWDGAIRKAFAAHGFRPVATRNQFVMPMALHRASKGALKSVEEGFRAVGITRMVGNPVIIRLDRV